MKSRPAPAPSTRKTDVLQVVRDCLAAELAIPASHIAETDQLDLLPRADSVRLMRVIARLEDIYDAEFDDDQIRGAETVAELADLVLSSVSPAPAR
jgi:acyl carrier protein